MGTSLFVRFMGMEATVCTGSDSGASFVRKAARRKMILLILLILSNNSKV